MHKRALVVGSLVLGILVSLVRPASAGTYDDPFFLGWTAYLPPTPIDYLPGLDPNASVEGGECLRGSINCVDQVIRKMTSGWRDYGCDHNGVFALTYLITTIQYRDSAVTPGFYQDHPFLNHYDATFADFYFRPQDAWERGDLAKVPPAWRIAFQAADANMLTGYGDMALGMNAHIIRDLPFVLFQIGLTSPTGVSRKADHDKVNVFLNAAGKMVVNRVAGVYDETIDESDVAGTTADNSMLINLIEEWREEAWRKAELLEATPSLLRPSVVQLIENDAASRAMGYVEQYRATAEQTAVRDNHCAASFPAKNSAQENAILTAI